MITLRTIICSVNKYQEKQEQKEIDKIGEKVGNFSRLISLLKGENQFGDKMAKFLTIISFIISL